VDNQTPLGPPIAFVSAGEGSKEGARERASSGSGGGGANKQPFGAIVAGWGGGGWQAEKGEVEVCPFLVVEAEVSHVVAGVVYWKRVSVDVSHCLIQVSAIYWLYLVQKVPILTQKLDVVHCRMQLQDDWLYKKQLKIKK
jgi:hypothetical protein